VKAGGAAVAAAIAVALLGACGTQTWSFDGDASAPGCSVDTDCTISGLHCDPASGQCVACVEDSQCTQPGLPRCDSTLQQCVQCGLPDDCASGQICEPTSHTCLTSCADGGACPGGTVCSQPRGVCVGCSGDPDCASSSSGHVCDTANGQCVQCLQDAQCTSPTRRCNPATDHCVQCLTGSDCDDHVCNTQSFTCVDN
jgi:hypothetical protein